MERFEFVCNLGEGAFGQVWQCMDKETGRMVAMKRFKEAHTDELVMRLALREIRLLKASIHPNVVHLNEAFQGNSGRVYMVMEHVQHALNDQLRNNSFGFCPRSVKLIFWQLVQATAFLHSNKVMHRDLKPANILLTEEGVVKLCDFGFARALRPSETANYTQYVVTRWYRPPELLVGGVYGTPVDIWALGCLFCELATGDPLFPGSDTVDQLRQIMCAVGPLPLWQMQQLHKVEDEMAAMSMPTAAEMRPLERRFADFSPEMLDVMKACLQPEPAKRLSALEILALPYFDDIYTLLEGTQLQHDYDAAYAAACEAKAPSALSLRPMTSACIRKRAGSYLTMDSAQDFSHVGTAGSPKGGLGQFKSTAALESFSEAQGTAASKGDDDVDLPSAALDSVTPRLKKQLHWGVNVPARGGAQACPAGVARKLHRETMNGSSLDIDCQAVVSTPSPPLKLRVSEQAAAASAMQAKPAAGRHRPGPRVEFSGSCPIAVEPRAASETNLAAFSGTSKLGASRDFQARRSTSSSLEALQPPGGPRTASSAHPLLPSLSLSRTPADASEGTAKKTRRSTLLFKTGGSSILASDAATRPSAPEAPRRQYAKGAAAAQQQPQQGARVALSGSLLVGRSSGDSITEDEGGLLAAIRAVSASCEGGVVPEAPSRHRLPCIATGFTSAVQVSTPVFQLGRRALSQEHH